jgi:hypothetical protein
MCDCIKQMDEALKDRNLEVNSTLPLFGKPSKVVSHLVFVDESKKKRGEKAPLIDFHFCPFCGEKYEPETTI